MKESDNDPSAENASGNLTDHLTQCDLCEVIARQPDSLATGKLELTKTPDHLVALVVQIEHKNMRDLSETESCLSSAMTMIKIKELLKAQVAGPGSPG